MKVLLYNDNYKHIGGVETYFLSIYTELKKRGHEVYIFSFGDKKITEQNKLIYKKPEIGLLRRTISSFIFNSTVYSNFKRYIKKIKPQIIHLNHNQNYSNSILLSIKKSKPKALQSIHDYSLFCPRLFYTPKGNKCRKNFCSLECLRNGCVPFHYFIWYSLVYWTKRYFVKKVIKYFITGSKNLKEYMESKGLSNVYHIPYAIDVKKFKLKIKKRKPNILFVGRLTEEKGTKYLIMSMPLIIKHNPKAKLVIIGDGDDKEKLVRLSKNLKILKHISFLGKVNEKNLIKNYQNASVVVFPTLITEALGYVGIEALACGTPCLAPRTGGIPEYLEDGKNGYFINPRSPKDIAEKAMKIINNPALARKFGMFGRKKIEKEFSIKKQTEKLLELYKKIIG